MEEKIKFCGTSDRLEHPRLGLPACLSGLIALLLAFPIQMGLYASAQSGDDIITPFAIPDGTPIRKVTFLGTTLDAKVTAFLDKDNGDQFFTADDPDNEVPTAMAYSKKTGRSYIGVVAASGPMQRMGKVNIVDSQDGGDPNLYSRGRKRAGASISLGVGTPVGMATLDSPNGDILIVASVFFPQDVTVPNPASDTFAITAFMPNANGVPSDGNKRIILPVGSNLDGDKINFSFGGLALANVNGDNILYANVVNRRADKNITGAIVAFNLGKDGIPENPPFARFINPTPDLDPNPMTASSIVPFNDGGNTFFAVYGVNEALSKSKANSQINIYSSDGKFNKPFFMGDPKFPGALRSFGSALAVTHMNFVDNSAIVSFAKFDDSNATLMDSGLAMVDASGAAALVGRAPNVNGLRSFIAMVQGVPDLAAQQQLPMNPVVLDVTITPSKKVPRSGDFTVDFTASDDEGLASYMIQFLANQNDMPTALLSGSIESPPGMPAKFSFTVRLPDNLGKKIKKGFVRVVVTDKTAKSGMKDMPIKIAKK